ncbi:MAG: DNA-protecting protein DprA [Alphaproteobacteria bacterium]|nr:DNA-protecting protein DprA [Alphaproteobacteria bacterium]
MNYSPEQIDWLRLCRTETVGPITFYRLLAKFGTAAEALKALPHIIKNKSISICSEAAAHKELDGLSALNGRMIFAGDAEYPVALSALEDAPPVLSVLGDVAALHRAAVALVGSRNASLNGRKLAHKMAADLGRAGYVVVSGLARGIDTAAHQGAIEFGTVAVVAGGVDVVYPKENSDLYQQIIHAPCGAVISECALGTQPIAQHFPKRNRIVSGLCEGVVVVEANLRSGSLITARLAGEQGRDVMAVPGFPLDPRAEGTNSLLREGAHLVRHAADVVETVASFLKSHSPPARQPMLELREENLSEFDLLSLEDLGDDQPQNPQARKGELLVDTDHLRTLILPELSSMPVEIDELIRMLGLPSAHAHGTFLELELEGLITRLPGNRICLKSFH